MKIPTRVSWLLLAAASAAGAMLASVMLWMHERPMGSDQPPEALQSKVSFYLHIQPIFDVACVRCHIHGQAIGSLDLAPGEAYAHLVAMPSEQSELRLVEPGRPEASYLVHKLEDTHLQAGGGGMRMPMDGPPLSDEQLDRIRRWVALGASR